MYHYFLHPAEQKKKKPTEGGKIKYGFDTATPWKSEFCDIFGTMYVCICGYRENFAKILNSNQKCRLTLVKRPISACCDPVKSSLPTWPFWLPETLLCLRLSLLFLLRIPVLELSNQRPWSFSTPTSGLGPSHRFMWVHVRTALCPFLVRRTPTSNSHKNFFRQSYAVQRCWR